MTYIEFEPIIDFKNPVGSINYRPGSLSENDYSRHTKIDISEDEKNFYIDMEVPGIKKEDINIKLKENRLLINGEKKNAIAGIAGRRILSNGIRFGRFSKSFTINSEIVKDKINAKVENGVLSIIIEKLIPEKKEKVIEIN